jgi:hypothetical protein
MRCLTRVLGDSRFVVDRENNHRLGSTSVHSLVVSKRWDKIPKVHRAGAQVRCARVTSRVEALSDDTKSHVPSAYLRWPRRRRCSCWFGCQSAHSLLLELLSECPPNPTAISLRGNGHIASKPPSVGCRCPYRLPQDLTASRLANLGHRRKEQKNVNSRNHDLVQLVALRGL